MSLPASNASPTFIAFRATFGMYQENKMRVINFLYHIFLPQFFQGHLGMTGFCLKMRQRMIDFCGFKSENHNMIMRSIIVDHNW